MNKLARPITPDEVAAYNVAGVVLLKGVLDLKTVNTLRRHIDEATDTLHDSPAGYDLTAITKATQTNDTTSLTEQSSGQYDIAGFVDFIRASGKPLLLDAEEAKGKFSLDTGVASRLQGFRQLCLKGALPEIAAALLRSRQVNFFGDQIFIKEPQTRERTAYHQDAPYFEIEGDQCCVMWVPADPVTTKNGGMRYVRGSHKGQLYAPNLFISEARMPGSEGDLCPNPEEDPEKHDLVEFAVEPGDVLVHHYRTIHGSGGNLSRYQVRRAASVRYCGEDIRFRTRPGVPPQVHHVGPKLNDGDRLAGPDFPVVWQEQEQQAA